MEFDYRLAFSRNLGWFSVAEQEKISEAVIAIPGMGGVGGHHLHSLARLGFRRFKIADFDHFEVHNFNRQIGAKISNLGKNKCEAMRDLLLDIIPNAEVELFTEGVQPDNFKRFLDKVDIVVDGLDLYAIRPRIDLFDAAIAQGIPVAIAGPLGMGTAAMVFRGHGVSFSRYFCLSSDLSNKQMVCRFMAGFAPVPIHIRYLYHKQEVDMDAGRTPSLHTGVLIATSWVAAVVPKLVLGRGKVYYAPTTYHYDLYLDRFHRRWRPFGNRNPLQKILIYILERMWDRIGKTKSIS